MEELQPLFSVTEFNETVNAHLTLLGEIVVEGEISSLKISQGKFVYITIKDTTSSVDIFGIVYQLTNIRSLEEGMLVKVTGTPKLYTKTARFSINASHIIPSGEGALKIAYEKLKAQLDKEGLFAQERKRLLPEFPQKVGLITAKGSEAYNDFIKITGERTGGVTIYFYPSVMQGANTVQHVIQGIQYFHEIQPVDVLVITRGGGSAEDLLPFNDETLVRAVYGSKIPTVCAIGHEGDVSLIELTADTRASTPSNAAELVFRDRREVITSVTEMVGRMEYQVLQTMLAIDQSVDNLLLRLGHAVDASFAAISQATEKFGSLMDLYEAKIAAMDEGVENLRIRLGRDVDNWFRLTHERISHLEDKLQTLNPLHILKRGFSIVRSRAGTLVNKLSHVSVGEELDITVTDGVISSTVISLKKGAP